MKICDKIVTKLYVTKKTNIIWTVENMLFEAYLSQLLSLFSF